MQPPKATGSYHLCLCIVCFGNLPDEEVTIAPIQKASQEGSVVSFSHGI